MRTVHVSSIQKKLKKTQQNLLAPDERGSGKNRLLPGEALGNVTRPTARKQPGWGGRVVVVREVSEAGDAGVGGHTLTA